MKDAPIKPENILVTGVAGDLGQALVKCLRLVERPLRVIGCDPDSCGVGCAFVDDFHTVPMASEPGYLKQITKIVHSQSILAVIPASEPEMEVLSRAVDLEGFDLGAALVCQSHAWFSRFGDKLTCYQDLDGQVPLAPFADGGRPEEVDRFVHQVGFPCIVKSRRSWGSKSLHRAENMDQLIAYLKESPLPLVQAYISDEGGEFSLGAFASDDFNAAIAFKRDLGPVGASWYADNLDENEDVLAYAHKVMTASGLRGSCNIQVRKNDNGVWLLEINPRFSSLVAARAVAGFRDLEWALELALTGKVQSRSPDFRKVRFRRFLHEMIDFGEGFCLVDEWAPRSRPSGVCKDEE